MLVLDWYFKEGNMHHKTNPTRSYEQYYILISNLEKKLIPWKKEESRLLRRYQDLSQYMQFTDRDVLDEVASELQEVQAKISDINQEIEKYKRVIKYKHEDSRTLKSFAFNEPEVWKKLWGRKLYQDVARKTEEYPYGEVFEKTFRLVFQTQSTK